MFIKEMFIKAMFYGEQIGLESSTFSVEDQFSISNLEEQFL